MNTADLLQKAATALSSAKLLLESGDMDGACNRAYYAMFDAARAALMSFQNSDECTIEHSIKVMTMNPTSRIRRIFLFPLLLPLLLAGAIGGCASNYTRSYQVGETKIRCLEGSGARKACPSLKGLNPSAQWFIESAIAEARDKQDKWKTLETLQPYESAEFIEASDKFKKHEIPKEIIGGPPAA